ELEIDCQNDWTFHNSINGTGSLNINTGGHDFSFQDTTDTKEFTGTLILSDTTFNLSGNNTTALTSAVVRAGSGSIIKVGQGTQAISGFSFDGGAVNFGSLTLGTQQPASSIQVADNLDISGNGAVRISTPTDVNDIPQAINSSRSLLELDDNNATVKLIDASSGIVKGNGGSLQLQDASGQVLSSSTQQHIIRLGKNVAKGTYDYRLTSGVNNDGLYIGYGLTQLDLLTSGTDALELDANGKTGNAADMSARITGTGDLAFNSQKDETVSLSNQNNDYTGVTDIRGGNVLMNSDSALGQTSEIRLATDTRLDMNGHSQTAGKLNGAAGSVLNINGGNLTLTEGGVSAGILSGNGALNVSGGVLDITGASSALTATTTVGEKATVKVHDNDALGTGTVNTAGTLILGKTDSPVMLASSQVNITENGTLSGYGGVSGNVTNSGTLDLRADAPGNVLTVGGNYTGNNGRLLINTVLGDDSSATDKLVIKGDASGQTRVAVTNAGGTGAQTLNGIELIHVDGNTDSAEFVQAGRIAAGAYDYTLGRGQGSNSGNWYLTSGRNTPDPMPGPEPEPAPTPDPGSRPEPVPGGYDNDLRPEAGSYTANMAAANTLFVTRLHERLGPVQYTDVMTGETKNTSMWMRHEGGHNRWRDGTGQLKTQGNRYVVQLGGDIAQWGRGETDRWYLGVMAGYGNDHNNTDSVRTGYRSKGSVNGYSTGLYATWFANDETHNGAYLDTWAQYGWFDNHVKGDGLPGESWKSKGLTASLETGYPWKAGEFSGSHGSLNEWYVQPQAQVVWMGVKADEHRESNGTRVESTGDGNVRTRLGVKTWIKGHNRMDDGKSREFRPFVEVNWLHNTREFGTRMNGVTVHQDGARNIGEVKAGVEGQINNRLNLWGNVGVQAGDRGYSDTSAMLGVKYTF
ncbi:autotransporter outer membrane beta-barrel domain-containing protein, partial [Escherichia coli]|nr:autotransporter outer membrane beta-barrel domain-containing protein [Escherichia coli]